MAHFFLTPVGSSGDVHPFVGIGRALRERGHDVTLLTAEPFRRMSERAGLKFVGTQLEEAFDRVTKHPDLWHSRRGLTLVLQTAGSVMRGDYPRIAEAYEPGRTVLIGHALSLTTRSSRNSTARRPRRFTSRRRSSDRSTNSPRTFRERTRQVCRCG
jgi:rhamnosyltransferase subunit B